MSFQTTRQMKDYRQSSQPVCGAVATLFSVYGLKQPVPHESLKLLQDTSWPSGKITKNINQLGKGRQITAKMLSAHTTVKLPGLVNMKLSILLGSRIVFQQRKSHLGQSYREKLKPRMSEKEQLRLYEETLRDLMEEANNTLQGALSRCFRASRGVALAVVLPAGQEDSDL